MNTDSNSAISQAPRRQKRSGMALVLVLSCLVLLTGILVAFFASVTTDLNSSKGYANGISVKELADTAVSAVMGSIKTATSSTASGISWASQPGMIRTFDDTGAANNFFKLYSSNKMVLTSKELPFKPTDDVAMDWKASPGIWTDLNAPAVSGTNLLYPILDPNAVVEGFSITQPIGYTSSKASGPDNNQAPMPVRWLYVLRDGRFAAPSGATDPTVVGFDGGSGAAPSKTNPIVGRVAFWTDDESCKLNINTASEPTAWDTPRVVSGVNQAGDMAYGWFQPAYHEFQRYPGHPATIALSPVLFPNQTLTPKQKNQLYAMLPRTGTGGSQAGTVTVNNTATANTAVNLNRDRLYSSVDEFLFAITKPIGDRVELSTAYQNGDLPVITSSTLNQLAGFLTVHSRAPELNLFGRPRVAMWPISSNTNSTYRTLYDTVIGLCSTVGNPATSGTGLRTFYFTRNPTSTSSGTTGAYSPTDDYKNSPRNVAIYQYLEDETSKNIPGFGGDFLTKWGDDRDQVLTEIFDYIRCTNLRDPQPTSGFQQYSITPSGYSADGQVAPISITAPRTGTQTQGFGRFHTISQVGLMFICNQEGSEGILTRDKRYYEFRQAYLADYARNHPSSPDPSAADLQNWNNNYFTAYKDNRLIQAAILIEPYTPSVGWYHANNDLTYQFTITQPFSISVPTGNFPLVFPNAPSTCNWTPGNFGSGYHCRSWGGSRGVRGFLGNKGGGMLDPGSLNTPVGSGRMGNMWPPPRGGFQTGMNNGSAGYPLISSTILLPLAATSMNILGGEIQIKIYSGHTSPPSSNQLIQTVTVRFPVGQTPVPTLVRTPAENWGGTLDAGDTGYGWVRGRTTVPTVQPTPPATPYPVPEMYFTPRGYNGFGNDPASFWVYGCWEDWAGSPGTVDPDTGTKPIYMHGRFSASTYCPYVPSSVDYLGDSNRAWNTGTANGFSIGCIFRAEDVVRSMVPKHGDIRLIAALKDVPATAFVPAESTKRLYTGSDNLVHLFSETNGPHFLYGFVNEPGRYSSDGEQLTNVDYHYSKLPQINPKAGSVYNRFNDFDNGSAQILDGAYINKPDEGNASARDSTPPTPPYYYWNDSKSDGNGNIITKAPQEVYFSPNRMIPSPMMLGSLPTGVLRHSDGKPHAWETLLFHPPTDRDGNSLVKRTVGGHPGWESPRDHLIADLFWMPVVEPYPLSDGFSTAGKVNMNYAIVPFSYIRRATAMHGVLKGEAPLLIPSEKTLAGGMSMARIAKLWDHDTASNTLVKDSCTDSNVKSNWTSLFNGALPELRKAIDPDETLKQFDKVFNEDFDVFRCATQICEQHLVRVGESLENDYKIDSGGIWTKNLATGDNTRERPYANLYGKLTTKSNAFTVHMRVQALQQSIPPGTPATSVRWAQWDEKRDRVLGEYRGSSIIERYIDCMDPQLANFDETYKGGTQIDDQGKISRAGSLDPFYRFRVLSVKKFGL